VALGQAILAKADAGGIGTTLPYRS
jgi:hypothetical protein